MAAPAPCPLLGDGITDDALLNIARFPHRHRSYMYGMHT